MSKVPLVLLAPEYDTGSLTDALVSVSIHNLGNASGQQKQAKGHALHKAGKRPRPCTALDLSETALQVLVQKLTQHLGHTVSAEPMSMSFCPFLSPSLAQSASSFSSPPLTPMIF